MRYLRGFNLGTRNFQRNGLAGVFLQPRYMLRRSND